ncbi:MAG TPA: hypothetical protein VG737_08630 [Cyclobacteriaceae bacterium]|nr:hypothetical protein [Cyclobacteriaceae bacterium]
MEFVTYKSFFEQEHAEALGQVLTDNNIPFQIAEDKDHLDSIYGDKKFNNKILLRIRPQDFARADEVILKVTDIDVTTVDQDHYLFSFSDDELFEILSKPDEWSAIDFQLAQKILKQRGKEIDKTGVDILRKQRINQLEQPEPSQKSWVTQGYIASLAGGVIGVFIGWHILTAKKILPDGRSVYTYRDEDRKHGPILMIFGTIMFLIAMAIRVYVGLSE